MIMHDMICNDIFIAPIDHFWEYNLRSYFDGDIMLIVSSIVNTLILSVHICLKFPKATTC